MSPELEALRGEAERFSDKSDRLYAAEAWRALSAAAEGSLGTDDPRTLAALSRMAGEIAARGKGGEGALEAALRARDALSGALGQDSPEALYAAETAAVLMSEAGEAGEARRDLAGIADRAKSALGAGHPQAVSASVSLGYALLQSPGGDPAKASAALKDAAEAAALSLGADHPETLNAESTLALAVFVRGRAAEAVGLLRRVMEKAELRLGRDHPDTIRYRNSLALVVAGLGDREISNGLYMVSLRGMRRSLGPDHPDTVDALDELAASLRDSGDPAGARDLFREALEDRRRALGSDHPETLSSMVNLAYVLEELDELAEARDLLLAALEASRRAPGPEHPDTLRIMNDLGFLLYRLGAAGEARDLLAEVMETTRRALGPEHANTLTATNNLAVVLGELEDYAAAAPLNRDVLEARRRTLGPRHEDTLTALNNLAVTLVKTGALAEARDLFRENLEAVEASAPNTAEAVGAMSNLAFVLGRLGEGAEARALYARGLELETRFRDPDSLLAAALAANTADLCIAEGREEEAVFYLKLSVQATQNRRRRLGALEPELRRSWLSTVARRYRLLFDLLMRLGRREEALWVLGLFKEDERSEFDPAPSPPPAGAPGDRGPSAPPGAAAPGGDSRPGEAAEGLALFAGSPEEAAGQAYAEAAAALAAASAAARGLAGGRPAGEMTAEETARLAALNAETRKASAAFLALPERIPGLLPAGKAPAGPPPPPAADRLQTLREALAGAGEGAALIYAVSAEEALHVVLVTGDGLEAAESAVKREELAGLAMEFRAALRDPGKDPRPAGERLYGLVMKPLEKPLEASKARLLMLSLDGALRYVPMAALWDGERWLSERYPTVIVTESTVERMKDSARPDRPSARAFGVTREWPGFPALPGVAEELAAVVKDSGAASALPATAAAAGPEGPVKAETAAPESSVKAGTAAPEGPVKAGTVAPESPAKAGAAGSEAPGRLEGGTLEGEALLDGGFTREALALGLASDAPVVHVASHFRMDPSGIANTALLLGDGSLLSLADIKSSPDFDFRGLDLLTLSACDTASGDWRRVDGREVESFGEIVQRAGGSAVLATLSPIDDQSAPDLMRAFYRLRYLEGKDKASALREAQLSVMRNIAARPAPLRGTPLSAAGTVGAAGAGAGAPPWGGKGFSHPYYWSPFILMGDWK
ncbi:MAG: tetratricopeptide repeat protein [Deltaproteobacteria bacterium]|jgi:CHAT domain-containing protein|nr:tetratricopeptide repeat protein [Deltaproteobacteria bacterium]